MGNTLQSLLHSRKALIATVNIIASTLTLLLGHFLDPQSANFYIGLVAMWQPVVLIWIKTIADEDNSIRANPAVTQTVTAGINPQVSTTTTAEVVKA